MYIYIYIYIYIQIYLSIYIYIYTHNDKDIIADLKKAGSPDKKGKPATGVQAAALQT